MKPTMSYFTPPPHARRAILAPRVKVRDVADASRSAGLAFAWGALGFSRRDLATWLAGPYARAIAAATPPKLSGTYRAVALNPELLQTPRELRALDDESIETVVAGAHARTLETLRGVERWSRDHTFARDMVESGFVVGVSDDGGAIGFAPADAPRMRLVDRVRSLFVADYLTRPEEFATFRVCDACAAVSFDARAHEGCATGHSTRIPTLPGIGDAADDEDFLVA